MTNDLRRRVDEALREFVHEAGEPLTAIGEELVPVAAAVADFVLDSGKRLRPAFCYWAARAAGQDDSDALVRAASSLELLQACALVHDDVIDHSDTRRGQPAVHERFARLHHESGWAGSSADFGAGAAILIGDLLMAWSEAMLATSGLDDAALRRTRPVSDLMRLELTAGQYLDILEQAGRDGTVDSALRVARLKTAKYTIERPMHLGAAIAGADATTVETFSRYGVPLGEAFQLRDDLLGVFGDPAVTGKPAGDDLMEGKRTVLIALVLERANKVDRQLVVDRLGDRSMPSSDVDRLREIVIANGVNDEVERMIDERVSAAVAALDGASLAPDGRDALLELATAATRRIG